jgi:exopolysaccharide production protein ExoQ
MPARLTTLSEGLFCFFAISVLMGAYTPIPSKLAGDILVSGEQNPVSTAAHAVILLGLAILCTVHWRRIAFVASQSKALFLFVLLAGASAAWSSTPDVTLRRVVILGSSMVFSWYVYVRFPMETNIRMVARCALISGLASALVAITMPRIGIMAGGDVAGDWNGVYTHKNELGWMMVLGVLSYGWLWMHERRRRVWHALFLFFCVLMSFMARSATSVGTIILLPVIGYGVRIAKIPGITRLWVLHALCLLVVGSIGGAVLSQSDLPAILGLLGRDSSLTGRVPLWGVLIEQISQRPIIGYGFGGYFVQSNPNFQWIVRLVDWQGVPEAHEGYIELLLQLGVVGFLLGIWIMVVIMSLSLSRPLRDELIWADFAAVFVISLSIMNLSESLLLSAGDIYCMILSLMYSGLRAELGRRRIEALRNRLPTSLALT